MIWIGVLLVGVLMVLVWIALELATIRTVVASYLPRLHVGLTGEDGVWLQLLHEHAQEAQNARRALERSQREAELTRY